MLITVVKPGFVLSPYNRYDELTKLCEWAGRTCYKSEDKITVGSSTEFCERLLRQRPAHESVIEHATLSAKVTCSRSCSHQLVRHRIGIAISQESQRFCDAGKKGFQVLCPPSIGLSDGKYYVSRGAEGDLTMNPFPTDDKQRRFLRDMYHAYDSYAYYRAQGVLPEDAREVLPNATKTELAITLNLRAWRHVFQERALNPKAQWQIRGIFMGLLETFADRAPSLFADLLETTDV